MHKHFMLASGWGIVYDENGRPHWVYIPLWDPPKFNEVGRALLITMIIKQHLRGVVNEVAKDKLKVIIKEQAKVVAAGYSKAMDADDDWCGTKWPYHFPGGGGPVGPDPDNPIYKTALGEKENARLSAKINISMLGKVLKNDEIVQAASLI